MVLLLAKFLFVVFLAKFSSPDVVVQYGVLVAAVSVAVTFAGLDFYTFANRELMRRMDDAPKIFTNHIVILSFTYSIIIISAIPLSYFFNSYFLFIGIVAAEHLSQELIRILIARRSPILATITLAPKAALWIVALLVWKYNSSAMIEFPEIATFWIAGALVSTATGLWFLHHELKFVKYRLIDQTWIIQGLKSALIMLVAGVIARCFFLLDRLFMKHLADVETVSAYVLFTSLFTAVYVVVEAAVFQFSLPELVDKYHKGEQKKYFNVSLLMALKALSLASIGIVALVLFIDILLRFIGKQTYLGQNDILYACSAITLLYVSFLSTHFVLYSMGRDLVLLSTSALTAGIFILANLGLPEWAGSLSVPIHLAASLACGVLLRLIAIWLCRSQFPQIARHLHSGAD